MVELNLWVVYDVDGNYECHTAGADEAMERYADEIGGNALRRCVQVTLTAPEPQAIQLNGTVPGEEVRGAELKIGGA